MTAEQMEIDFALLVNPVADRNASIQEKFEAWIDANPWVMPRVERLIERLVEKGAKRVALKQIWEVLRYSYMESTGDVFKCNNNYTSRASRLVIQRHPEWAELIETRELKAA